MPKNLADIAGHLTAEETLEMFQLCWTSMAEDQRVEAVDFLRGCGLGDYVELDE